MANYTFLTPTILEGPAGNVMPFYRARIHRGISIVKSGGVYSQVRGVDANLIPTYDEFYLGGTVHTVTDTVRTALIAGGVGIDSTNFTLI